MARRKVSTAAPADQVIVTGIAGSLTMRLGNPDAGTVIVGRHPVTGVIHRLTLRTDGSMLIERGPYEHVQVSAKTGRLITDRKTFEPLESQQDSQAWLIHTIKQFPAVWPY